MAALEAVVEWVEAVQMEVWDQTVQMVERASADLMDQTQTTVKAAFTLQAVTQQQEHDQHKVCRANLI